MSAALPPPPMTLAEFLAWEERQELRYEFDGFGPVAMTGGNDEHAGIAHNLHRAVGGRLPRGGPCRFRGSDLKFLTATGKARYPDGMVVCSPPVRGATSVADPVVVFEVLSPSTAEVDRVEKADEYRETPSVRRYVILEQRLVAATVFTREPDGDWVARLVRGEGATLRMPEIGVEVPLAELYEGLDLGPGDPAAAAAPPSPGDG